MNSQPLWIFGAPRSGTTFLASLLNAHPEITLTIEGRFFALVKQLMEVDCARADLLDEAHRNRFVSFLKQNTGPLLERYYREELGVDTVIWGDKHPSYGDPALLSGRQGSRLQQPPSGSALRLIDELLPNSKFIHIHRAADQVAHSLLSRGWVPSLADGEIVRQQYVDEIESFFEEIDADRKLTLAYSNLLQRPDEAAVAIARFLAIEAEPLLTFLHAERQTPTPYSEPVRDLNDVYRAL